MLDNQNKKVFNLKIPVKGNESNLILLSRQSDSEMYKLKEESSKSLFLKKIQEKNDEGLSSRSKFLNPQKLFKEDEKEIKVREDDHRNISKRDKIVISLNTV